LIQITLVFMLDQRNILQGQKVRNDQFGNKKIAAIVKNYYTQNTTTLKQIIMM